MPSTRTSATSESSEAGASSRSSIFCIWAMCDFISCSLSIFRDSTAMAQARGLAINVGPCINTPASPREMVSATSAVVSTALIVRYPAVSPFPIHIISGCTPAHSHAKNLPVLQNPVAISSNIRYMSYLSHRRRASTRNCG